MGSPRYFWAVTVVVLPLVSPPAILAQTSSGRRSSDAGQNGSKPANQVDAAHRKPPKRGRSRTSPTREEPPQATNDWNPHYLKGKAQFIEGHYDLALTELQLNVAECDQIDFELMKRQNGYFEHIWNNIPNLGQSPHDFIRSSNLQWVGAALAAKGQYDSAESHFGEMANYAEQCFRGRMNTFQGCACQGLAFVWAARGRYAQAAERYRLALAHVEANESQIGLPPAPCVALILVGLADVELARGRLAAAEQFLERADRVQAAQRELGIGPAELDRAAYLTVFAQLRQSQLRYSEAYDLYADGLATIQKIDKKHPISAYCFDGLGEIELVRGRLDQSEEHFGESRAVRQAGLGEGHREVAYSLDGLARVAAARGKHEEAESLFKQASAILTRDLGSAHPDALAIAKHADGHGRQSLPAGAVPQPHARFLAIPTLLTVGWQVLHLGKDWRIVEANIRRREDKEARAAHRTATPKQGATIGR
jgi:tetratricopeptide (TPR) repeat protein